MLLPSDELRELSKRVDVCLSGKTAPKGCDIRYRQLYWLMVFNDGGELMALTRVKRSLIPAAGLPACASATKAPPVMEAANSE